MPTPTSRPRPSRDHRARRWRASRLVGQHVPPKGPGPRPAGVDPPPSAETVSSWPAPMGRLARTAGVVRPRRRPRRRQPPPCASLRDDVAWKEGEGLASLSRDAVRGPRRGFSKSKQETTTGARAGRGRGRGRTRVVVRDGVVHAGLRLRRCRGVRHGAPAEAIASRSPSRGRLEGTSTDVTDEIGKGHPSRDALPSPRTYPSSSCVKDEARRASR